jgi:hypothetical protein
MSITILSMLANANAQSSNAAAALMALEGQLKQIGLQNCMQKIKTLSKYLMGDQEVNFAIHPVGLVNQGAITISISSINPRTSARGFGSLTLSTVGNVCSGAYEQVNHWQMPCLEVKNQVFPNFSAPRQLQRDIFQAELNSTTHTYFIPDQSGCTTVKKEIIQ